MKTDLLSLARQITPLLKVVFTPNIHKPSESGASLAWVATADEIASVSGKYFEGRKEIKSSELSYNIDNHDDLWQWTVKYYARDDDEAARFEAFN